MRERYSFVDIAKCLAILMIVDVHLTCGSIFQVIGGNTFHVSGFFTLSGIVYGLSNKKFEDITSFVSDKISGVMYPYFTFSVMNLVLNFFMGIIHSDDRFYESIIKTITFHGIGTLWFFPVFFLGQVFFFLFIKSIKSKKILFCFSILLFCFIAFVGGILEEKGMIGKRAYGINSLSQIFVYGPIIILMSSMIGACCIGVGYAVSDYIRMLARHDRKNVEFAVTLVIISLLVNIFLAPAFRSDLHCMQIGSPIIFIIATVVGNIFMLSLAIVIDYVPVLARSMSWIGKNSIIIMTTHKEFYLAHIVSIVCDRLFMICKIQSGVLFKGIMSLIVIFLIESIIIYVIKNTIFIYLYVKKQ